MASSVVGLKVNPQRKMLVVSKQQFIDAVSVFEHPSGNPELNRAYQLCLDDVVDLLKRCSFRDD